MNWENIIGQENLKNALKNSIAENRISHAQLFVGKEGYGVLPIAMAYAKEILALENPNAANKVETMNHLDLHFSFPVFTENKDSTSKRLYDNFREMILENPYSQFEDWTKLLESENKQFFISANEMEDISQKFSLKSFEGGTKILIVWRADKMNTSAANKFLKLLEEPPAKTLIFLTAESTQDMLPTILSRTQIVEIPRIEEKIIEEILIKDYSATPEFAQSVTIQSQGNWNEVIKNLKQEDNYSEFEELFITWVRNAFMVKTKPENIRQIIHWSRDIAAWNREKQKNFLEYCAEIFRLALMQNYADPTLVYKKL
ncbi:MAG: DNA polymerase III subunit delta', partial [Bacteroidetes bacterium]|nr:DNA polymerase III subunit delta' [Bacteroidota bacterium]